MTAGVVGALPPTRWWQRELAEVFVPVAVRSPDAAGVACRHDLGDLAVVRLELEPQRWDRRAADVMGGGRDLAMALTASSGQARVSQAGATATLSSCNAMVIDGALPLVLEADQPVTLAAVLLDRDAFARRLAPLRSSAGVATVAGLAAPVAAFLGALPDAAADPQLSPVDRLLLAERAIDLMQLLVRPDAPPVDPRSHHLVRALGFIEANLDDPDLSPRSAAEGAAVSVRYLHELFRSTGTTVRQHIIRRRLARARDLLIDPTSSEWSITTIAAAVGFKSAAHFTQCYVVLFGETPSSTRSICD